MLSTPPAFILSQDQTLMFKYDCLKLFQNNTWLFFRFVLLFEFLFLMNCLSRHLLIKEFQGSCICPLKNFCMIYTVQLSMFICCLLFAHASALLDYHVSQTLSTTFLLFSKSFLEVFSNRFRTEKEGFEPSRRY